MSIFPNTKEIEEKGQLEWQLNNTQHLGKETNTLIQAQHITREKIH
ncbi:MAG: hypothetical protein ACEY3A_01975 [Wolbachia sp.]